jgi:hypothetical protein
MKDDFIDDNEENFNKVLSIFAERQADVLTQAADAFKIATVMTYKSGNISKTLLKRVLSALASTKLNLAFNVKYSLSDEEVDEIIKDPTAHHFSSEVKSVRPVSDSDDEPIDKSKLH